MAVGDIIVRIGGDVSALQKSLKDAEWSMRRAGRNMKRIGGELTMGLTVPIAGVGAASLITAAKFEKLRISMQTLVGSAEEGNRVFERLQKFSASTPFQLEELARANNTLLGFGISADEAYESLKDIGDIAAIAGGDINAIAIQFGQAAAEGRVMTKDLRSFISNGVPILKMLADATGHAQDEILDLASQSKISFKDLQNAFRMATDEGGMFADGMEKQSKTLFGLWSTLKDNISIALSEIGQSIKEAFNLSELIPAFIERIKAVTEWFQKLSPATKRFAVIAATVAAAIGPLIFALGAAKIALASMIGTFTMVAGPVNGFVRMLKFARLATIRYGVSFKALNMIMRANPIGLIVTALGILIPVIISGYNNSEKFRKIIDSVWGAIKGFGSAVMIVVKNALKPFANTVGIVWDVLNKDWAAASKRLNNTIEENNKKRLSLVQQTAVDLAVAWGTSMIKQVKKQTPELRAFVDNEMKRIFGRPTQDDMFGDALMLAPKGGGKKTTKTTPSPTGGGDKEMADSFKESTSSVWELVTGLKLSNSVISDLWGEAEILREKMFAVLNMVNDATGAYRSLDETGKKASDTFKESSSSAIELATGLKLSAGMIGDLWEGAAEKAGKSWGDFAENLKNKLTGIVDYIRDNLGGAINAVFDIWGQSLENKEARQQQAYEAELERIESSTMSEKAKQEAISELNKKREKEEKKMAREKAKREKAMAIFQAVIQTAAAVTKVIANPILAGIVAALGAIQIGVIASEPLPALAKGGLAHGPTQAIVGDNVGARTDPEVISPLSKLKQYMGGGQQVKLTGQFRVDGQDLIYVIDENRQIMERR